LLKACANGVRYGFVGRWVTDKDIEAHACRL